MTETVIALYLGRNVGWCTGAGGMGAWSLPKDDDLGRRTAALVDALHDIARLTHPAAIVLPDPTGTFDAKTKPEVAVLHIGLLAVVSWYAHKRRIRLEVPNITVVREAMLGKAEFPRDAALRDAVASFGKRRGIAADVDALHALVLWSWFDKQKATVES